MIRNGWVLWGSVAIGLTCVLPLACSDETVSPTTSSSNSSSSGSGGGGAGGGSAQTCMDVADCTDIQPTYCGTADCNGGLCELVAMHEGEAVAPASDVYGDCKAVAMCVMGNSVAEVASTDSYNDGNECTIDGCSMDGAPTHDPVPMGDPCAGGQCDGNGNCVECIDDTQCTNAFCQSGACVPSHCTNMMMDMGETGTDCGGNECGKCPDGSECVQSSDCMSDACTGMPKVCVASSCMDIKQNGDETGEDCGGSCPACPTGLGCLLPTDCESGVCQNVLCAAPTCTDGVQNSDETAVDCGGATCSACAP